MDELVGRAGRINYDTYSGYIRVSSQDEEPEFLFYLLFTSQDQNPAAPLLAWYNGGPGCSSMEGATTENGPLTLFDIKGSGQARAFSKNLYGLNAHANVLYIDQPRHVGFSYGYGDILSNTAQAAQDQVTFFNAFFGVYPEYAHSQLVLTGESYAGRYIPAFANALLDYNSGLSIASKNCSINLAALAIGNGCINSTVQNGDSKFVAFLRESSLLPEDSPTPATRDKAMRAVSAHIGYKPVTYDFRLAALECDKCSGGYNYTAWADWMYKPELREALHTCGNAGYDAFKLGGGCIPYDRDKGDGSGDTIAFDDGDAFDYTGALGRALDAGVLVKMFYGKTDLACHYLGGLGAANAIAWTGSSAFRLAAMKPLFAHGDIEVGQVKAFSGLSFYQLEQAGHMSFIDQPASVALVYLALLRELALGRQSGRAVY